MVTLRLANWCYAPIRMAGPIAAPWRGQVSARPLGVLHRPQRRAGTAQGLRGRRSVRERGARGQGNTRRLATGWQQTTVDGAAEHLLCRSLFAPGCGKRGVSPLGFEPRTHGIVKCGVRCDACARRRLAEYGQPPLRIDAPPWAIGRSPSVPSRRWLTHGVGNPTSYPASREQYGPPDRRIDVPSVDLRGDIGADPRLPRDVSHNPTEARTEGYALVEVPSAVENGP